MKHMYSFLSGVALISLCVVGTRSLPGYMFLLGFCVSSLSVVLLGRAIGASRIARFFSKYSDRKSIRFASHWNSDAENTAPVPQVRYADTAGWSSTVARQAHNLEVGGSNPSPATISKSQRRNRQSLEVSGGSVVPRIPSDSTKPDRTTLQPKQPRDIRPRRYSSAARNATSRQDVVQSSNVLPQVQQDVLSALMNLKVPFADAEQAVLGAAQRNAGASFDEMFRIALALVQAGAGKSRRVA